jgi:phosphatidylserine/phosphatidylglycerophosphate/cardiolipin synthase-like enzyme
MTTCGSPRRLATSHLGRWLPGNVAVAFDRDGIVMALEAIEAARTSIDLEMFLIGGDIGRRVLRLLDRKARAGVSVRLIHHEGLSIVIGHRLKVVLLALDRESRRHPEHHFAPLVDRMFAGELRNSPIRRARYPLSAFDRGPRFLRLAHDKLIIVDGRVTVTGGMNLADAVAGNHDLMLRITGTATAGPAEAFAADWRLASGEASAVTSFDDRQREGETPIRFLVTRPGCQQHLAAVLAMIDEARQRIDLQMFFLTAPSLVDALVRAHRRGVALRLILDPNEYALGLRLYGAPNVGHVGEFIAAGVPLRFFRARPGIQMHQKSMLVDEDLVYAGATNFTRQSFLANTESAVVVRNVPLARRFAERFEHDWQVESAAPDLQALRRRRVWARCIRTLSPLI